MPPKRRQKTGKKPTRSIAELNVVDSELQVEEPGEEPDFLDEEEDYGLPMKRKPGRPSTKAAEEVFHCPFIGCRTYSKTALPSGCKKQKVPYFLLTSECLH